MDGYYVQHKRRMTTQVLWEAIYNDNETFELKRNRRFVCQPTQQLTEDCLKLTVGVLDDLDTSAVELFANIIKGVLRTPHVSTEVLQIIPWSVVLVQNAYHTMTCYWGIRESLDTDKMFIHERRYWLKLLRNSPIGIAFFKDLRYIVVGLKVDTEEQWMEITLVRHHNQTSG
jgi:hypothetical protein